MHIDGYKWGHGVWTSLQGAQAQRSKKRSTVPYNRREETLNPRKFEVKCEVIHNS